MGSEDRDIAEVPTEDAYRMAMKTMLRWAKKNMDPNNTRVFFTSMSPTHAKSVRLTTMTWSINYSLLLCY